MSPIVITGLVLAGLILLVGIAYTSNVMESRKLEAARRRGELADLAQRAASLAVTLPGQMLNPSLRMALARLELQWSERLLALDKRDPKWQQRIKDIQALIGQGDAMKIDAPVQKIATEAKAKEVRNKLEDVHNLFARAAQDGLLPATEAKHWQGEIRRLLVIMHADYFSNAGNIALQQNQPRQARLAFERAVQYLNKQPDIANYATLLRQLKTQLAQTDELVLAASKPEGALPSELTEGLKALDEDDGWKKKNLYE